MNVSKHGLATIKHWATNFCLFVALILVNAPSQAQAQALCVPYGFGGAYGPGPPVWWQAAGTGFARFNTWVDDPRWSGAASVTHGDGANHDVQFRALYSPQSGANQFVYLSWWQKFAMNTTATRNRVYLGVRPDGATTGLLLLATFATNSPSTASANAVTLNVHVVDAQGNFGPALSPRPSWVDDVRVWISQVTDQSTQIPSGTNVEEDNNWAVHVRLPIGVNLGDAANTVTLGSTFNLWYELLQGTPGSPVVAYSWPFSTMATPFLVTTPGGVDKLPPTNVWPQALLGANESNTACKGVTLDDGDITVTNATSGNDYLISTSQVNTFHAKPANKSGGDLPIGSVHARFRIANWGVQVNMVDADPTSGNWNTVGKRARGPGSADDERGLDDVAQGGMGNLSNGAKWDISGTWTADSTAAEEAGFFDGSKSAHQCIQVELFSSANVPFLRSSAFRNMRVVSASEYRDTADVSVLGLPNTPEGKREVFLAVRKFNMPAEVTRDSPKPIPIEVPPTRDPETIAKAKREQNTDELAEQERFAEFTEYERRFASEPSYVIRGYYDSGQRMKIDNEERTILLPMVAFGYFVNHEGSLEGWKDSLSGLERVAPDFYKVKVPDNSAVKIGINIEAVEGSGFSWWWLLLILLLIILILIFRKRASTP